MSLRGPKDATPEAIEEMAKDNIDMAFRIKELEKENAELKKVLIESSQHLIALVSKIQALK